MTDVKESKYPHIGWVDLENNGVAVEVALMKRDGEGNLYFIPLDNLDDIDKRRLLKIVTNRNAPNFELWDLMSQITLGNGVNALEYFHQLVKILTVRGVIMEPQESRRGVNNRPMIKKVNKEGKKDKEVSEEPDVDDGAGVK